MKRHPIRCRLGWHRYDYRVVWYGGMTYDRCSRCGDEVLVEVRR